MTKIKRIQKSRSKSQKIVKGRYITKEPEVKQSECREFFDILTEFIDSELTESHLIKIRNHLSTCLRCTRVYQDVRILIRLCQSEAIDEPVDVSSQLWRILEKRFKTKRH
jgi:hypothetical protein